MGYSPLAHYHRQQHSRYVYNQPAHGRGITKMVKKSIFDHANKYEI